MRGLALASLLLGLSLLIAVRAGSDRSRMLIKEVCVHLYFGRATTYPTWVCGGMS